MTQGSLHPDCVNPSSKLVLTRSQRADQVKVLGRT